MRAGRLHKCMGSMMSVSENTVLLTFGDIALISLTIWPSQLS